MAAARSIAAPAVSFSLAAGKAVPYLCSPLLFCLPRMNPILVQDFLEISYRADLDLLVGRWLRPVELAELQHGYALLLDAAVAGRCRYWLLDVRRRQNTHQIGAQWMVTTWLPQLGPRLGGRTRLAYLLAPAYLRNEAADAAFPAAAYFDDKPFIGERFIEEKDALAWLNAEEST